MTDAALSGETAPILRLVTSNPDVFRPLMPIRVLEGMQDAAHRHLLRDDIDAATRARLSHRQSLIVATLAARPLEPARARRLEQELRWLTRIDGPVAVPHGLWQKIGALVRAILHPSRPATPQIHRQPTDRTIAA